MEESLKTKIEATVSANTDTTADETYPQKIVEVIEPIINSDQLSNEKKVEQIVGIIGITHESFRGPIPHPQILKGYQEIVTDAPERIIRMAEKEQMHRQSVENEMLAQTRFAMEQNVKNNKRTQIIAVLLLIMLIGIGTLLTWVGEAVVGGIIFGTTIIGIASIFITGTLQKESTGTNNK